jgi:hypothetical protein
MVRVSGGQLLAVRDQVGGGAAVNRSAEAGAVVYEWCILPTGPVSFTAADTLVKFKLARQLPGKKSCNLLCPCTQVRLRHLPKVAQPPRMVL